MTDADTKPTEDESTLEPGATIDKRTIGDVPEDATIRVEFDADREYDDDVDVDATSHVSRGADVTATLTATVYGFGGYTSKKDTLFTTTSDAKYKVNVSTGRVLRAKDIVGSNDIPVGRNATVTLARNEGEAADE